MITTDILIIGAGPTGLFTVFEAGLLKLRCHLIDALPQAGGQCSEIYPKKPIYDIPAYPEILAGDLTDKLLEQIKQFEPGFTLGERAETIEKQEDETFVVTTNKGTKHHAKVVAIAGGLGSFEPRKPPIPNISDFEDKGVEYIIRDPEFYRDKVGYELDANPGGDAAGKGELGMPVKGANNVGTQEDTVDPNCTFCEGGSVSRVANQIPSINAIAGLHDVMQVSMGTSLWRDIFNIPGMALAAGTTYAGFLGNALNATPASLYVPLNFTDKRDSDDYTWIPAGGY